MALTALAVADVEHVHTMEELRNGYDKESILSCGSEIISLEAM
jgi:uncharacterized protein YacL (UPF0231 family)